MKRKLLVAYDGSDFSETVLADLQNAGLGDDVEACVVTVAEVWLPPESKKGDENRNLNERTQSLLNEAQLVATNAKERLAAQFPKWIVTSRVRSGSPAWEIVTLADDWQPDLIVVGSKGEGALSRVLLGSVSKRVLAESRCSVRIARPLNSNNPNKIVIGLDGSKGSEAAVIEVASREWLKPTEVRLTIFDDPFVPSFISDIVPALGASPAEQKEEERWANKVLRDAKALLNNSRVEVVTEVREGNPKSDLPELAESLETGCIFVGSTGSGSILERFVLGSVSEAIAVRSTCSVEVVRSSRAQPSR